MENKKYKILLVDDEPDILEFLSYNIKKEGFEVYTANNGKEAIGVALKHQPHLIILDVMMPEMDGMETCEAIRQDKNLKNTIVAFLTARGEDYSQIAGFDAGADDYITKPIKPKVLVSRINALLKRIKSSETIQDNSLIIEQSNLIIDKEKYIVIKDGAELLLPKKEFELLLLLISKPDKVFTRDEIYSSVWGDNIIVGDRTIDVHIRKLREKIGDDHIRTIKGVGYKFVN
ncbi:MAG: DNA-binding response regulator [Bacteroidetes bacterium GWC2_33_15]|nr:MAG: DNA-binding response regulator [Bacteroidetes bacterium GWA2_33_15]OFX52229.1 MAG: DNA-binding response regulator [Bacteroidetes bacterium GWC2_33_15]OFX64383.1 MAG: DNA-binding response regulator [Bacteroidetes bacterium GWB2_32_14]OFX67788.1 MAG: DNA-binding response regulator [Bacteroidetes bacterium GWD2_33_33]HAN19400.1 DNA-binding response regulator [Bacteroidales bacterium]